MLFSEALFLNFVFSESLVTITLTSFVEMVLDSILTAELYIAGLSCPPSAWGLKKKGAAGARVVRFSPKD
jgi:hypothetical protein